MGTVEKLWHSRLLDGYFAQAVARSTELENTALRGESTHMRHILAYGVTHGTLSYRELVARTLAGTLCSYSLDLEWLGRLAYVCALQNSEPQDVHFATTALRTVNSSSAGGKKQRRLVKLEAELLFEQRRFYDIDNLLAQHPEVRSYYYDYLATDARSPFVREHDGLSHDKWLERFNRQFADNDLLPVELRAGHDVPFNRLRGLTSEEDVHGGPLVTVIMTAFKPQREDILQSARSILEQTWQNIELLVLDDASPAEYTSIFAELEELDARIRVVRLEVNAGTYAARNVGIAQARGDYITGQDSDDWSHPQRIEKQVTDLLGRPEASGNQVYTVNMTEDLTRIRRGYPPYIPSAPTLMVGTRLLRELGGYLPARKASDNELRNRVAAYAGKPVGLIKDPLIFMRILPDSLSRADFRPGWQHPARRAFWSAYKTWHATSTPGQLRLSENNAEPVYVPPRFTQPPAHRMDLDVVIAADWCEYGHVQAEALEELQHLLNSGKSVGVLHLENALHLSEFARIHCEPLEELISSGQVQLVMADEDFHDVGLLLIRAPELLQFMPSGTTAFTPERVAVVAQAPPRDPHGGVTYLPGECASHAERYFGRRPLWLPGSEAVRNTLAGFLADQEIADSVYTPHFNPEAWMTGRRAPLTAQPRIGRWCGVTPADWPTDQDQITALWPLDGSMEVRLYGDPSMALRALGAQHVPAHWVVFEPGHVDLRSYYRALDFFVHYAQTTPAGPERPILEALASGCVVVLPPSFQGVYADAAIYATPSQAQQLIRRYCEDHNLFYEQSQRGVAFAQRHAFTSSEDHILELLAVDTTPQNQEMMAR